MTVRDWHEAFGRMISDSDGDAEVCWGLDFEGVLRSRPIPYVENCPNFVEWGHSNRERPKRVLIV